ncbi:MAG TPA: DUF3592 domain-containing protein [Gemmatimonadales bacterium]|nr:DUF3592 domain-containing protein [Gemmatimonadales bacterium]
MPPGRRRVSRLELANATVCLGLLLGGSFWIDRNGTPVVATVTGKHEEVSVHDSPRGEWSRDYRVGVEFERGDGTFGSSSVRVLRERFDSLRIGEPIAIRYVPALPRYARTADRSTAQVLREALSVFLDDSFFTPLLTWLAVGSAALWILAHFATAAVFVAGVMWIVAAWFLLFPAPGPIRLGQPRRARGSKTYGSSRNRRGHYVRTHGGTGSIDLGVRNLAKPYQVVRFRYAVPGGSDSAIGVDAVDSASVPGLALGSVVPVRYDPGAPREARLSLGSRTFRDRNRFHLRWPVIGAGALVVFAAALGGSRRRRTRRQPRPVRRPPRSWRNRTVACWRRMLPSLPAASRAGLALPRGNGGGRSETTVSRQLSAVDR